MAHTHPVVDSDSRFVINSDTRAITTASDKLELIQGDHQSERITFEIPRVVEGHDMSLCDRIEIHYINIDRKTKAQSKDIYIADDVTLDGEKVVFTWLISGNATRYYGRLNFIVLFECLDEDGNYTYKWNTEICKLLTVGEGISNTSAIAEDYSDILEKFKNEVLGEALENSVQPDWNQNDETAKDYIKNRPGGYPIVESTTTTLNITRSTKKSDNKYSITGDNFVYSSDSGFVDVEYDGTLHKNVPVDEVNNYHFFGDATLTKYPFYFNEGEYRGGGNWWSVALVTKESPEIKVTATKEEVVKIPYKYLDVEQADWNETDWSSTSYIKGKPDVVTYNLQGETDPSWSGSAKSRSNARKNISAALGGYRVLELNDSLWSSVFGCYNSIGDAQYCYEGGPGSDGTGSSTKRIEENIEGYVMGSSFQFDYVTGKFVLKDPVPFPANPDSVNCYIMDTSSNNGDKQLFFITKLNKKELLSASGGAKYYLTYEGFYLDSHKILSYSQYPFLYGPYVISVGNGTSDIQRSNAHTLDWDGNAWFSGDVYTGSTSGTNRDDGSKKLATEEYVDSQKFSGSYNDLTDTPMIPTVAPFSIDSTSSDYSTTSTAYGDQVKSALLAGRDVWYIGAETDESGKTTTKYTKVSWFNIEKTDTEAKLIVGVGARTDDNSGAVTFAVSV